MNDNDYKCLKSNLIGIKCEKTHKVHILIKNIHRKSIQTMHMKSKSKLNSIFENKNKKKLSKIENIWNRMMKIKSNNATKKLISFLNVLVFFRFLLLLVYFSSFSLIFIFVHCGSLEQRWQNILDILRLEQCMEKEWNGSNEHNNENLFLYDYVYEFAPQCVCLWVATVCRCFIIYIANQIEISEYKYETRKNWCERWKKLYQCITITTGQLAIYIVLNE